MVKNFSKKPQKEINDDETWMWERKMNIGTWNVRSVFWSGTLKVLHNGLSELDYDIVALQETRIEGGIQNLINLHYLVVDQKP
jgi:hypothetical protein